MSEKSTNQVIAEWMGKCSHRPIWNLKCGDCGLNYEPTPDYESDLNAVREAELKAVEVFGEVAVAIGLEKAVNEIETAKGICTHDEIVWRSHFADSKSRAKAIRKLIEG